jgi:hypothetical protein
MQTPYLQQFALHFREQYQDAPTTPLFAFGYGLSYANLTLGALAVVGGGGGVGGGIHANDTITLAVPVTNHCTRSNCGGSTVVQLYFRQHVAPVIRYYTQLVRFKRVHVAAGAITTVKFRLRIKDMSFYNNREASYLTGPKGWSLGATPGNFTLTAGLHAPQLPNKADQGHSTIINVLA